MDEPLLGEERVMGTKASSSEEQGDPEIFRRTWVRVGGGVDTCYLCRAGTK